MNNRVFCLHFKVTITINSSRGEGVCTYVTIYIPHQSGVGIRFLCKMFA